MTTRNNMADDEIPQRRLFTIGEAANIIGSKPHILRYWEKEIQSLGKVQRRNNRRYYSREQLLIFRQINNMLISGMTLAGVNQRLLKTKKTSNAENNEWLRQELEKVLSLL